MSELTERQKHVINLRRFVDGFWKELEDDRLDEVRELADCLNLGPENDVLEVALARQVYAELICRKQEREADGLDAHEDDEV